MQKKVKVLRLTHKQLAPLNCAYALRYCVEEYGNLVGMTDEGKEFIEALAHAIEEDMFKEMNVEKIK